MADGDTAPRFVLSFPPSYERFRAGVALGSAKQKRWWHQLLAFLIWVIVGLAGSAALNRLYPQRSEQGIAFMAILAIVGIYLAYCTIARRRRFESLYRASLVEAEGDIQTKIFEDRIEIATGVSRTIWQWRAVKSAWRDRKFFYFSFSDVSSLLIPLSAFSDETQIDDLKRFADERI